MVLIKRIKSVYRYESGILGKLEKGLTSFRIYQAWIILCHFGWMNAHCFKCSFSLFSNDNYDNDNH